MGKIKRFRAICKPSLLMRRMIKHKGDVSEGTQFKIAATRKILKRVVIFYHNGLRVVEGTDLTEQEMHDSEILRLAHASLLINGPVGDKRKCYVDATVNPVEIWIHNMTVEVFLKTSKHLVETQQLGLEFLLEEPISKTLELADERNVRLFGNKPSNAHLSHKQLVKA